MAVRGAPQALKVSGKLSALQPQPTRCSSGVWVTRGHLPRGRRTRVAVAGLRAEPGIPPCCRMRLPGGTQREGNRMGRTWG